MKCEFSHFLMFTLRYFDMTVEDCSTPTSTLESNPSHMRELELSRNKLRDTGVKNLSDLLMKPQFKLEKLKLVSLYCTADTERFKNKKILSFIAVQLLFLHLLNDSRILMVTVYISKAVLAEALW